MHERRCVERRWIYQSALLSVPQLKFIGTCRLRDLTEKGAGIRIENSHCCQLNLSYRSMAFSHASNASSSGDRATLSEHASDDVGRVLAPSAARPQHSRFPRTIQSEGRDRYSRPQLSFDAARTSIVSTMTPRFGAPTSFNSSRSPAHRIAARRRSLWAFQLQLVSRYATAHHLNLPVAGLEALINQVLGATPRIPLSGSL